jgi:hypothetical protein
VSRRRLLLTACCAAALALAAVDARASGRYDPRLRFRVLRTAHFTIYYHQGGADLAQRLAAVAERVRADLAARTGLAAPSHAYVVLVDQSDIANGWSTPAPYNLIEIAAIPPPPSSFLGHHDDWLHVVFAHEYAHVFHLDRVGGVMRGLRWVLGRNAATFPNLFVPLWQVEGFATWAESALTGFGRVHAADVAGVVAAASSSGRASIDRAGGGLVAWPSGNTPYFQGGVFDETLAARHTPKALGALSQETARRIPFLGGPAYREVLDASAGELWREIFAAPGGPDVTPPAPVKRLTHDGFAVSGPRVVRAHSSAGGEADAVIYSSQGPHRFPDIRMVGMGGGASMHVESRFDGQALSSDGRWLYYDQLEFDGAAAVVSDLYARDLESGRVTRLSRGQRLTDPDIDAAGTRLAAVVARDGQKRLTLWRVGKTADGAPFLAAAPEREAGAAGCQYASPRWSPDGTRVAAVRQCTGELPTIVEMVAADGREQVVASGGRNVTPAWSRDGRAVLFASDRGDGGFKLYAVDRSPMAPSGAPPRVALEAPGGVMWPDVAPDGHTVVFTSLTADGYDVFAARLPEPLLPSSVGHSAPDALAPAPASPPATGGQAVQPPPAASEYSPWRTLLPRAWSPLLSVDGDDVRVGASVGASDALGYHEYSASALWLASGRDADFSFDAAPLSWSVSYAYNRWRPSLLLSTWSVLDTVTVAERGSSQTFVSDERSQGFFAGVLVPWRRVRLAQSWLAGVGLDTRRLPAVLRIPDRSRNGFRAGWAINSSKQYGYSISGESGAWAAVNLERVTTGFGADGDATSLTGDARVYLPGLGRHHVAALRLGAASSAGDAGMTRHFDLGGSGLSGQPFGIDRRTVGLLRGLPPDDRQGTALLVANVDYRFPLVRVERGIRTWPFFLRDVHAAVFADVGSAGEVFDDLPGAASSIGAEVASRITLGYTWDLNVALGGAWVRDPSRPGRRDRFAVFVRTGYAF